MGITFHIHPGNMPKFLTKDKHEELTNNEKIVLYFTRSLKSSYAGISNYRFHEAHRQHNISLEDWNAAKESLIQKGLLAKNSSITVKGKNAINSTKIW
jgi:hypothetical protein